MHPDARMGGSGHVTRGASMYIPQQPSTYKEVAFGTCLLGYKAGAPSCAELHHGNLIPRREDVLAHLLGD